MQSKISATIEQEIRFLPIIKRRPSSSCPYIKFIQSDQSVYSQLHNLGTACGWKRQLANEHLQSRAKFWEHQTWECGGEEETQKGSSDSRPNRPYLPMPSLRQAMQITDWSPQPSEGVPPSTCRTPFPKLIFASEETAIITVRSLDFTHN